MVAKSAESLTSHVTSTSSSGMPPPFSGSGANRVHSTTLAESGSPDATPSVKGSPDNSTGGKVDVVVVASVVVAASVVLVDVGDEAAALVVEFASPLSEQAATTTAAPAARNDRRDIGCIYAVCLTKSPAACPPAERDHDSKIWTHCDRLIDVTTATFVACPTVFPCCPRPWSVAMPIRRGSSRQRN
jgi:hypothetical protein